VAPSATFGMTALPAKSLRIGVSGQLPFWIHAPAKVDVRLPTAAPFDRAHQEGDSATVTFRLPAVARAGIEYRTNLGGEGDASASSLRVELAYVREFWSLQDTIDIRSKDIRLLDISGFPSPFGVAPITLPRGFQDSSSFRLGGELRTKKLLPSYPIDLRAGVSYETSGIPQDLVSPQTYDANKIIASLGIGIHVGEHWRMDGMGALVMLASTTVDPAEAAVPRVDPVRGNPTATESINGGDYSARALVLGVGVNYVF
jgi:long-subunit fatty acid transport protein